MPTRPFEKKNFILREMKNMEDLDQATIMEEANNEKERVSAENLVQ